MKYCPELVKQITDDIKEHTGRVNAAKRAGICYDTFCTWMKEKPEFSEAVKEAEEEAKGGMKDKAILTIAKAMDNGLWTAAAWWLERNYPDQYGKSNLQVDLNVMIDGTSGELA